MAAAQPHFADAADRGQRRAQLMRYVSGKPPHLIERPLETAERLVEHAGQPAHLVVRVVHWKPVVQPLCSDGPGVAGHPLDWRQRPAGEHIAAKPRRRDRHRKSKDEQQREVAQLGSLGRVRTSDLDHDTGISKWPLQSSALGHDSHRSIWRFQCSDPLRGGPALGNLAEHRLSIPIHEARPIAAPHLDPGQREIGVETLGLVQHVHAAVIHIQTGVDPVEVLAELAIQRLGHAAADEDVHPAHVDAEHHHHGEDIPEREPHPDAVGSPPPLGTGGWHAGRAHGSPSRSMKPTPRTV